VVGFLSSSLSPGRHYEACLDLDGEPGPKEAGDIGLPIYVSGISIVSPKAISQAESQLLALTCSVGCKIDETASSTTVSWSGSDNETYDEVYNAGVYSGRWWAKPKIEEHE